jgi:hypothetical protein
LLSFIFLFLILFLNFVIDKDIFHYIDGQMSIDSFSAAGTILIRLVSPTQLDDQEINNSIPQSNLAQNLPLLRGAWELLVQKGDVNSFQVLLNLTQGDKVLNTFAINNLKTDRYIQLNDKGTEIISGTVDFISKGLKNGTLSNIGATISITGLTDLRIAFDDNSTAQYISIPIVGQTNILLDAKGNILIGPTPAVPPPSPANPVSPQSPNLQVPPPSPANPVSPQSPNLQVPPPSPANPPS